MEEHNQIKEDTLRDIPSPILLSSSKVITGEAICLAIAVGEHSGLGKKLKKEMEDNDDDDNKKDEQTSFQKRLELLGGDIGKIGLLIALATLLTLFVRFFVSRGVYGGWDSTDIGTCFMYLILAISILIVSIPEGLPLAVIIYLSYSGKKMLVKNIILKEKSACENFSAITNICTDKTGVLTTSDQNVVQIFIEGKLKDINMNDKTSLLEQLSISQSTFITLTESICANIEADIDSKESMEKALRHFIEKFGVNVDFERDRLLSNPYERIHFDSNRKKMSTIIFNHSENAKERIFIKGSVQEIIDSCSSTLESNIEPVNFLKDTKEKLKSLYEDMSKKSYRTLAIAYKDLKFPFANNEYKMKDSQGEYVIEKDDFVLIAIVGFSNPLRENISNAVDIFHNAGVTVRMVTGDDLILASQIGIDANILQKDNLSDSIMDAKTFNKQLGGFVKVCEKCLTEKCQCDEPNYIEQVKNLNEFAIIKDKLKVLANATPDDKRLLITALKQTNEAVAVTGNSHLDLESFKLSDVGIAMGIAGCQAVKDGAFIILCDDNFCSIINCISYGRNLIEGIKKFLQFQLTVNLVVLTVVFLSVCCFSESILRPIHLLWINIIMDNLAALNLTTDNPSDDLLVKRPCKPGDFILTTIMLKHIISQTIYQIIILFIIMFAGEYWIPEDNFSVEGINFAFENHVRTGRRYNYSGNEDLSKDNLERVYLYSKFIYNKIGPSRHFTFFFATFIFMQIFNQFNCRKINNEWNIFGDIHLNFISLGVMGAEVLISVIFIEFGRRPLCLCFKVIFFRE